MDKLYILAIISIAISFVLTPLVKKFAIKVNAIDIPKDERRIHKKPIPLLGGLAIYISFILTLILKMVVYTKSEIGIIIGATIIVIGGIFR